jgi:regulatory protein
VTECLEAGEITHTDAVEKTREAVLRTLDRTAKSRSDLERSLALKGYPQEVAEAVLDRLTEVGLIDDAALASSIVRTRHTERGLSRRAIAQELRRKGIPEEIATQALEQVDDAGEQDACAVLAARLLARTRGQDHSARVRKAVSALARRGYGAGLAYGAVNDALEREASSEAVNE